MENKWYKNAILYALDVKTFQDDNGDGIGDFPGLIRRLPYLKELGINLLWLLPFYPSEDRDNGYDIIDYYNVDPRLGTLDDFADFMREAKRLGIRVIIDLVIQHTSISHPWFKAAETDPASPYHKYYIWAKKPQKSKRAKDSFAGEDERAVWDFSPRAGLWYHHWFYHFQPDLDVENPEVQKEIIRIVQFWLAFGISGFRVDAAGLLFKRLGIRGYETKSPGAFLRKLRQEIGKKNKGAIIVGEADVKSRELKNYFGKGDRMHMLFCFLLNQYLALAIVDEDRLPIEETLRRLPKLPRDTSWVNFIRNLDEYNIEKLGPKRIRKVRAKLHISNGMWIYNRGIKRRIAPMIKSKERLRMIWSLVFALPGIPFIAYGDEIGMGDDLSLPFRLSVRTPMQWNKEKNGGFSKAQRSELYLPVIDQGSFSYKVVNVAEEKNDPDSQLSFIKKLIALRKDMPELGLGKMTILKSLPKEIAGFKYSYDKTALILCNLSARPQEIELPDMAKYGLKLSERSQINNKKITLRGYGFAWLRAK